MLEKTYLQLTYGAFKSPTDKAVQDGRELVCQCLAPIKDLDRFPPRLLVLLATPSWQPYRPLLAGIHAELETRGMRDVPLIGSSVAACVFDHGVHEEGALLVCLASLFIEARVALAPQAREDPEGAVRELMRGLEIEGEVNPRGNQFLLAFFPGFSAGLYPF